MALELGAFADIPLDEPLLALLIDEHETIALPRLRRLWSYYRNALAEPNARGGSRGSPAQAVGLPKRLTSLRRPDIDDRTSREIVIENDIAWRIHTLVDFMFPSSPRLSSKAANPQLREKIEAALGAVIDANGGAALFQNAALLGAVYGHVDFLVSADQLFAERFRERGGEEATGSPGAAPSKHPSFDSLGSSIAIETVEAPRAIPLLRSADYRALDAYILHFHQPRHEIEHQSFLARLTATIRRNFKPRDCNPAASMGRRASSSIIEIHSATHVQRYEDGTLVREMRNRLGRLPVVHIQNLSQPLCYEGLSDVEPLIPLQDELNTRLSDRANRVTMQSFRMWLGKGIDGFTDRPVGPGQMWMTDNLEASIEGFGGDADSPSEKQHIEELREAMDKASGVTPAAAGHINAKVGNLTSENALRISLMGTLAKIKRKRITYGAGIASLCELILHALHVRGVLRTEARDRAVDVVWSDPLPIDETRRITDALAKSQLGVPASILRAELGYPDAQPAAT